MLVIPLPSRSIVCVWWQFSSFITQIKINSRTPHKFLSYHYYVHLRYEMSDWFSSIVWSHARTHAHKIKLLSKNWTKHQQQRRIAAANDIFLLCVCVANEYRKGEFVFLLILIHSNWKVIMEKKETNSAAKIRSWLSKFFWPFLSICYTCTRFDSIRKWV